MSTVPSIAAAGKYLTFGLAQEVYGLEILRVQEIVGLLPITRVPRLPASMAGVVNLRGRVVPIVDLRRALGMPDAERTERTCIVIARLQLDSGDTSMGLIVDDVSDVVALSDEVIEATPEFGGDIDTSFMRGVARVDGHVVLLLDIDRVLSDRQAELIGTAADAYAETQNVEVDQ